MNPRIPHLSPHLGKEDQNLILAHAKSMRQQNSADTFKIPLNVGQSPEPNLLELWILGPVVDGPLERLACHVDEALLFEALFVVYAFVKGTAEVCRALGG